MTVVITFESSVINTKAFENARYNIVVTTFQIWVINTSVVIGYHIKPVVNTFQIWGFNIKRTLIILTVTLVVL